MEGKALQLIKAFVDEAFTSCHHYDFYQTFLKTPEFVLA
jgi:hypothetical protein